MAFKRDNKVKSNFSKITIGLASPEEILENSYGEVTKPETINYRTYKPERDGLFCERIFGPTKDYECACGKYKRIRYKGIVCDRCGVEVTEKKVRRERAGHIELVVPVAHIWYFRSLPNKIGYLLGLPTKKLEQVIYYEKYIVIQPGVVEGMKDANDEPLNGSTKLDLLSEDEYINIVDNKLPETNELLPDDDPKKFIAKMGAEAIYDLLCELSREDVNGVTGLDLLAGELRERAANDSSQQRKTEALKRLQVVNAFNQSKGINRPEWMIMDVIPVIPPDIRPMVQLDGGRFATSDLNDLYRRVINRNNRLKRLLELGAPDIIVRNEKRMLQEAVDALIDNGRRGRPVTGPNNRPLKSLSDMLKGKQGRFRQNLLGKRVDYSGRSVIVVGPELKMYQCGLPKEMALELFKPFVMKDLVEKGIANNIKSARKMVERTRTEVWDSLEAVIKGHPVMLNRAPTLHRLGIQAFEPVLVEGRAIKLHPLVCTAFNADFDGDQMAVHVPLSEEAQREAKRLMLASGNLLKPADGKPVTVPTQDMVLGSYYLTMVNDGDKGEGKVFRDENEAVMAYQEGVITLQAKIRVRRTMEIDGTERSRIIDTTVGRIIFNQPIPQDLGYVDRSIPENRFLFEVDFLVNKKKLGQIIDRCIQVHGTSVTAEMLDRVKAQGYKYSTKGAVTVAVSDAVIPPQKAELLASAEEQIGKITKQYNKGLISNEERYNGVIKVWSKTTEDVASALQENLDARNPIFMMADSGARGSMAQIRQLAGMRGLIANTSGKTIEIPIRANYREGLNILEYFIAGKGARKGLADTALRTADSGYLTRRLVDVSQDVIIREEDCGAAQGIMVSDIREGNEMIEKLEERLQGRFAVNDILDPATGEVLVSKDKMMSEDDAKAVVAAGIKEVEIRSVLCCDSKHGVCSKCYGANLANGRLVGMGEAVGIIAAQSIGEPGTQLTMRTFHTGGIASAEDITQGLPRVEELFEARRPKNLAIMTEIAGTAHIDDSKKNRHVVVEGVDENGAPAEKSYLIPFGQRIRIADGAQLEPGDILTEGFAYPQDILAIKGPIAVQNYLISEVQKVYRLQGVDICDKHIEVIVLQMMRKVRIEDAGSTKLIVGSSMDKSEFRDANEEIAARVAAGETDLKPARATSILLGITKASLATDSFLSAASFQETTRVLTDAAIKGKVDPLMGLKENVIIGKLIPAGTGIPEVEAELAAGDEVDL